MINFAYAVICWEYPVGKVSYRNGPGILLSPILFISFLLQGRKSCDICPFRSARLPILKRYLFSEMSDQHPFHCVCVKNGLLFACFLAGTRIFSKHDSCFAEGTIALFIIPKNIVTDTYSKQTHTCKRRSFLAVVVFRANIKQLSDTDIIIKYI